MDATTRKIAVIGPSQSGKTCLAVGLFATSTRGFTIEADERDCREYLDGLRAGIAKGDWPDATNKGTMKELRFIFQKKGKSPVDVSFNEFSGELLADEEQFKKFANAYLCKLSGVVLLANPGSAPFQSGDTLLLADTMAQYKRVISFLKDPNNGSDNAFVALTVTAADRITGDLEGKLDSFNETIVELSNTLGTSGFRWKRFDVSVTGRLESQDNPKMARGWGNTASRPFLWLLFRLVWWPRIRLLLRRLGQIGAVAAVALAIIGIGCWVDAGNDKVKIDKLARECRAAVDAGMGASKPTAANLDDARKALRGIAEWKGRWRNEYAAKTAADLDPRVWAIHEKAIDRAIADAREEGSKPNCDKVDALFAAFLPATEIAGRERETKKADWEGRKAGYMDAYAKKVLLQEIQQVLDGLAGKHGDEVWSTLSSLYAKLVEIEPTKPETSALKDELAAKLDGRFADEARHQMESDFDAGVSAEKADTVAKMLAERLAGWHPATEAGETAKAEIAGSIDARKSEAVKRWETKKRKECDDWVSREIRPGRERTGSTGLWSAYEKDARGRMREENPFFDEIVRSAVYAEVEKWFEADVACFKRELMPASGKSIWSDSDNVATRFRNLDRAFQEFRSTCRRIAEDKNPPPTTWAHRFAQLCIDTGHVNDGISKAFPQRIVATKLDIQTDYQGRFPTNYKCTSFAAWFAVVTFNSDGVPEDNRRFEDLIDCDHEGDAPPDSPATSLTVEKQWKTVWSGNKVCEAGLFQRCRFVVRVTDYNKWIAATSKTEDVIAIAIPFASKMTIPTLQGQLHLGKLGRSDGAEVVDIYANLSAKMSGETPFTLLEQAKRGTGNGGR